MPSRMFRSGSGLSKPSPSWRDSRGSAANVAQARRSGLGCSNFETLDLGQPCEMRRPGVGETPHERGGCFRDLTTARRAPEGRRRSCSSRDPDAVRPRAPSISNRTRRASEQTSTARRQSAPVRAKTEPARPRTCAARHKAAHLTPRTDTVTGKNLPRQLPNRPRPSSNRLSWTNQATSPTEPRLH